MKLNSYLVSAFLVLSCLNLYSQNFLGLQGSNALGTYNLGLQPAGISGQKQNIIVNLFGASGTLQNNYLGADTRAVRNGSIWETTEDNYREIFPETLNGKPKNGFLNYDFHLPSVSIRLSEDKTLAVTTSWRNFANVDNLGEPGAKFIYEALKVPDQFGIQYNNDHFHFSALSFAELGIAYAQTIYSDGDKLIRAGGRVKLLSGLAAAYFHTDELEYSFTNNRFFNVHASNVQFAHSFSLEGIEGNFNPLTDFGKVNIRNTGLGLDLGATYEFQPGENGYKARLGISILDLGGIGFEQSAESQDFTGSVLDYDLAEFKANGVLDFDSIMAREFEFNDGNTRFRMALPTAISLQGDFRVNDKLSVSVIPYLAVKRPRKANHVHQISNLAVIPRFEGKWWGVGIPVSVWGDKQTTVGATVRLGPFIAGSSTLFNFLTNRFVKSADVHFGLSIPITHHPKEDTDGDGIIDPKDDCPDVPGPKSNRGCPVEEPETVIQESVPTDDPQPEEGKSDSPSKEEPVEDPVKEETPVKEESLTKEIDPAEAARQQAIAQAQQKAREQAEEARKKREEARKQQLEAERLAREKEQLSMDRELYKDSDDDGLVDKYDQCPDIPGPMENAGCPVEEPQTEEIQPEVAENVVPEENILETIFFKTGSDYLNGNSRLRLNRVAAFLRKNPEARVKATGHTDDVGDGESNEELSELRSKAALKYLESVGIDPNRVDIEFFGKEKPAYPNKDEASRAKNRRVELILIEPEE